MCKTQGELLQTDAVSQLQKPEKTLYWQKLILILKTSEFSTAFLIWELHVKLKQKGGGTFMVAAFNCFPAQASKFPHYMNILAALRVENGFDICIQ